MRGELNSLAIFLWTFLWCSSKSSLLLTAVLRELLGGGGLGGHERVCRAGRTGSHVVERSAAGFL